MNDNTITCPNCKISFPRRPDYRHCCNCFACTGCEIYYCPNCDERIEITPVKPMASTKLKESSHEKQA